MKLSENWLREWINPDWDTQTLAEELSLAGLEVDGIDGVVAEFTNVVVGKVVSVEKHPDANKLNITTVDVGELEPLQIVCGAKNVDAGILVCCAKVGAVLPGNFKIKAAKLCGVDSNGMLCGTTEIGLADNGVDGLYCLPSDAPIGMDIRQYLDLDDKVIDVDLTPNRADCLSVEGIARDISAISGLKVSQPFTNNVEVIKNGECSQLVSVNEPVACPKYLGCMVINFDSSAKTPLWMKRRLERSSVTPKNLIVDVTNYVLIELGQPMHAYDADKLTGNLQVRFAHDREKMITFDGKELKLQKKSLVIADDAGVIALAGIMGGLSTAVSSDTKNIFFECANFNSSVITGRARQYGLHTDSSHRFERGVDSFLPERAMERALDLFTKVAGGKVSKIIAEVSENNLYKPKEIQLRPERITKLLGVVIADKRVEEIFNSLNFTINKNSTGWGMIAPTYRYDMEIEADLIEEIGRVFGYNNLPEIDIEAPLRLPKVTESAQDLYLIKKHLASQGFNEIITYSFVEEGFQYKLMPSISAINLKNPISDDMKSMRTTLFPGLLNTIAYNQNRQQVALKLFEAGLVFINQDDTLDNLVQEPMLSGAMVGNLEVSNWAQKNKMVDFYDLKAQVEAILTISDLIDEVSFVPQNISIFHPGQSAAIIKNGEQIGSLGQLHPALVKDAGVAGKVFMFDLKQSAILAIKVPLAVAISKFPAVQRDLAFIVEQDLPVQKLIDTLQNYPSSILKTIEIFDVYQGDGLEKNKKSIAISFRIQHETRTLQDEEIDNLMLNLINLAEETVFAELKYEYKIGK
jgi:phenylalanyl-tRNA synthetase beta chain